MIDANINSSLPSLVCIRGSVRTFDLDEITPAHVTPQTQAEKWSEDLTGMWPKTLNRTLFCVNRLKNLVFDWPRLAVSSHHQCASLFPGYIEQMFCLHYCQGFNELTNITLKWVWKALSVSNNVTRRQCWKRSREKRNPNKKVTVYPVI